MSFELKPIRISVIEEATGQIFLSDTVFVPAQIPVGILGHWARNGGIDHVVRKNAAAYRRRMEREAADRRDEERLLENYRSASLAAEKFLRSCKADGATLHIIVGVLGVALLIALTNQGPGSHP